MTHYKYIPISLLLILLFCSCRTEQKNLEQSSVFVELSKEQTGIEFENELKSTNEESILEYLYFYNGAGVGVADFDNDGLDDIYFGSNQGQDELYRNLGELKFQNVSAEAGLETQNTWTTGVSIADVNNDGWQDIYVCKLSKNGNKKIHNLLYINDGKGNFTEEAEKYGVQFSGFSTQAAFLDYDKDGDLDMYLLNHAVHSVQSYGDISKRNNSAPLTGDKFYENKINEGEQKFVEVTQEAGIYNSPLGYGLAIRVADINNDGWPDLYVGNDFHENDFIYINNGDKTFTESINSYLNHTSRFTMGIDIADMNNDGLQDIYTTDMLPYDPSILLKSGGEDPDRIDEIKKQNGFAPQLARNHFQLNMGEGYFSDVALLTKTYATDWSWSVLLSDFDNNGFNDIFISNGIVKRPNDLDYINYFSNSNLSENSTSEERSNLISKMPELKIPNVLLQNQGNLNFKEIKQSFVGKPNYSNGAAFSDFDLDGDLDLVINNLNETSLILENTTNNKAGFNIKLNNKGNLVLGTKVKVYSKSQIQTKELQVVKGFMSSSTEKVHFAIPENQKIDSIQIIWPNGMVQIEKQFDNAPNITITRKEEDQLKPYAYPKKSKSNQLEEFPFVHDENFYFDYTIETLIPEKLSLEGPALVVEDFNGDGRKDIFIGGARQQPASFFIGTNKGFVKKQSPVFEEEKEYEDVDAEVIDIDSDGNLDLYIVSGGGDKEDQNEDLRDRIYLNDGKGNFVRAPIPLPKTNGGSVAIADYDADGFQDIFIGGRSVPGVYGGSPISYVFKNKGEFQFEVLANHPIGMITDSQWVDIDGDELLDLVLVGDWMPITIMKNLGELRLKNKTPQLGLSNTEGLWNTIAFHDFDNDGDLDFIAGNVGDNLKWKASPEKPIHLYLEDFDANGSLDPIIFYEVNGEFIPFNSFPSLVKQIPSLKKNFPNYNEFSSVRSLKELLKSDEKVNVSEFKQLKELKSMLFINENGTFNSYPLPQQAQFSSIEDIEITSDGTVYFVGNGDNLLINQTINNDMSGGILKDYDSVSHTFQSFEKLPLPKGFRGREIEQVNESQLLIVSNNGKSFLYTMKEE